MNNAEMKVVRFDARDVIATSGGNPIAAFVTGHTHDPAATYHAKLISQTPQESYTYTVYDSTGTEVGKGYISVATKQGEWLYSSKENLNTDYPSEMSWNWCNNNQ